jgi:hypothetical protein
MPRKVIVRRKRYGVVIAGTHGIRSAVLPGEYPSKAATTRAIEKANQGFSYPIPYDVVELTRAGNPRRKS